MPAADDGPRALRCDARRNRDALLAAASAAFAVDGLGVPLEAIARGAGVSIGTLYRHFPTRLDLVQAALTERLEDLCAAAEHAAGRSDAWEGFCDYLQASCELRAADRGLDELAGIRLPHSPRLEAIQARILQWETSIVARAQDQGTLRRDVTAEDLAVLTWSQARVTAATREVAPHAWRRHLHLVLDGFRAGSASPLTDPALTREQLYQAMVHLGGIGPCGGTAAEAASRKLGHGQRSSRPAPGV